MIDLELLRKDPDAVRRGAAARGLTAAAIDRLERLDAAWREQTTKAERLRHEQRTTGEDIACLTGEARARKLSALQALAERRRQAETELSRRTEKRLTLWKSVPNLPLEGVPRGPDATGNVVREVLGPVSNIAFPPRDYLEIGTRLGILDCEKPSRSSGSRFGALLRDGALLEFALVKQALETASAEGFLPIVPPVLLKEEAMENMGYLERGADEVYRTQDGLLLAGTSEQAIGALHQGHTFGEEELPVRFAGFSSCFRREAGSHGRDVHGILRVHQFDKVELFSFCHPERSPEEHARFVAIQKKLMHDLGLTIRVVDMCTGDMGFSAAAQVDLETWFPSRRAFVETHSASNTTDFQTRRLQTRFRSPDGGLRLVHAVNGTAYAIQRVVAAIIETHQTAEGNVRIPEVLRPFFGGRDLIRS